MGLIYVDLKLSNPKRNDLQPVEAQALVDTCSVYLVIPEHVRVQVALDASMTKEVTLADGSRRSIPYVGPIETRFKNPLAYVGAIVMGDEVLLDLRSEHANGHQIQITHKSRGSRGCRG